MELQELRKQWEDARLNLGWQSDRAFLAAADVHHETIRLLMAATKAQCQEDTMDNMVRTWNRRRRDMRLRRITRRKFKKMFPRWEGLPDEDEDDGESVDPEAM